MYAYIFSLAGYIIFFYFVLFDLIDNLFIFHDKELKIRFAFILSFSHLQILFSLV